MSIITQYQRNIDKKILEIANDELQVFYRGHANNKWKLETTLQRKIKEEGIFKNAIAPLDKKKSVFENVAHMQHYGKPTRLLDFTSDFLIALYFACSDKTQMNETGCVYVTTYRTRKVEYTDIEIIMELSLLTEKCNLLSFSSDLLSKNPKIKERYLNQGILSFQEIKTDLALNILSWIDHGFMITPSKEEREDLKQWNPRLYNQEGVFFIAGNKIEGAERKTSSTIPYIYILPELADIPYTLINKNKNQIIEIPANDKPIILEELNSNYGINERYVYPDK